MEEEKIRCLPLMFADSRCIKSTPQVAMLSSLDDILSSHLSHILVGQEDPLWVSALP